MRHKQLNAKKTSQDKGNTGQKQHAGARAMSQNKGARMLQGQYSRAKAIALGMGNNDYCPRQRKLSRASAISSKGNSLGQKQYPRAKAMASKGNDGN